jgi:hypothetical protein
VLSNDVSRSFGDHCHLSVSESNYVLGERKETYSEVCPVTGLNKSASET